MDNEILLTLNQIKTAIYVLLGVVIIGVVANWIRAGVSIKTVVNKRLDDLFTEEACKYFDEGKFDELLTHCENLLETKPNHAYALWYKAKAYYQMKEYNKSKIAFDYLDNVEPGWSESHIKPYLEKIEAIEKVDH